MKSSTIVVIVLGIAVTCLIVTACVLCLAFGLIASQANGFDLGIPVNTGEIAPDFQLETIDGKLVSLQDFRGKPVLLNFWAIWCEPCQEEMTIIQDRFSQHYPDLIVLAVEEGDSLGELREYVEDEQLTFMVLAGTEVVAKSYNIYAYPTSFFIDADGIVRSVVVGGMTGFSLDAELTKIGIGD